MNSDADADATLGEFQQFVAFLKNLWAILAGASVLFPWSNELAQVIPLSRWPEGGLVHLSSAVVTGVTTLFGLFLLLMEFGRREQWVRPAAWRRLPKRAAVSFGAGVVALLAYLLVEYLVSHDFYFTVLGWRSDDLRCVVGDFVLLLTYALAFGCLTRAFVLLGLREYLRKRVSRAQSAAAGAPPRAP